MCSDSDYLHLVQVKEGDKDGEAFSFASITNKIFLTMITRLIKTIHKHMHIWKFGSGEFVALLIQKGNESIIIIFCH